MHDRLGQVLGVLGTDHDVAELARPERLARLVDRERQDVGRRVDPAVLAVQRTDLAGADEGDRQVAVGDAGGVERGTGGPLVGAVLDLDLDAQRDRCSRAGRSSGA